VHWPGDGPVSGHKKKPPCRVADISIHFNCYIPTSGGRGVEVLYVNHDIEHVAAKVSAAIAAAAGLTDRGAHHRSDLYWLNKTVAPALLLEIAFVDAQADVDAYEEHFTDICHAIASCAEPVDSEAPAVLHAKGKVSWFGGPSDEGVAPDEGLAFLYEVDRRAVLFYYVHLPDLSGSRLVSLIRRHVSRSLRDHYHVIS
jgi:hypothetical protein